ncbi:alpha/beta hydrolase [Pigmentiphaga soli]|uniref:Alpha/beta hydrolase n=1 Tax=Pigmentiphaga soli TaxID=1007095 RepID=A0ABP8HS85_9BURK
MPSAQIDASLAMHYVIDDYTDPWSHPETILMLHGNAESGAVWFGWVPHLARRFRIVRPDMRGFGRSTPMERDYPWSLDGLVDDYVKLMDGLGVARFHLIGAKLGGTVARRFAARHPDRIASLVLAGTPVADRGDMTARVAAWMETFEKDGVGSWARSTMASRLGPRFPAEGVQWWIDLMSRTPVSSQIGFMKVIPGSVLTGDLPKIRCPTLVITTEGSALGSVDQVRAWQTKIPRSELYVVPGDSYHVAASDSDLCAVQARAFIERVRAQAPAAGAAPA